MAKRRRNASQRYHDRVAGRYEQMYGDAYWQWHDGLTWEYLKPHLPADLRCPVIDLGCGTGKWGRRLLKSGYPVTFLDSSARMVDQAEREIESPGDLERATFVQADLMDLGELPAGHYGLATAMGEPVGCAAEPAKAIKQVGRILREGGVLVATFDNRVACVDHFLESGNLAGLERFLKRGQTHWLTRDESEQFEVQTFEPGQLEKLLSAAGFEVIEVIGKTVLPLRRYRRLLEEAADARKLAKIEKRLARDRDHLARCAHLQVAARKVTK